jgi:hypothetical protein
MSEIHGLVDGIEYRQHERTDELNDRIFQRIDFEKANNVLKPLYNPRPAMTKYSVFPVVDLRRPPSVPLNNYLDYSDKTFVPVHSNGHVDGYLQNVALESDLRNQYFALSNANQRYYVPSTNSDLYRNRSVAGSLNEQQPYPYLFEMPSLASNDVYLEPEVGSLTFFNDTRSQLRGNGF